jgi:hypothetical protein
VPSLTFPSLRVLLLVLIAALPCAAGCSLLLSLDEFEEEPSAPHAPGKDAAPDGKSPGPLVFNIILRQTVQDCSECGVWFDWQGRQDDKPKLVVDFEDSDGLRTSIYQHGLGGTENGFAYTLSPDGDNAKHSILVKLGPQRTGLFRADLSDIPPNATIQKATLHLHIQTDEGLADVDTTSVLAVHECERDWSWDHASWTHWNSGAVWAQPGGDFGTFVRDIRAKEDIRDRGFGKANPDVDFDFTPHVIALQAAR